MTDPQKADLHRYLQSAREALLWKLSGLNEYDQRRPLVPTGTNLAGIVKHVAGVEAGYLGDVFNRPSPEVLPWLAENAEANADLWLAADETVDDVTALYRRVWSHSDDTIEVLDLDSPGLVPWWSEERKQVTLEQILIHMIAETNRHAGHADIVRELIDGSVGMRADNDNLGEGDAAWWADYFVRVQTAAEGFR